MFISIITTSFSAGSSPAKIFSSEPNLCKNQLKYDNLPAGETISYKLRNQYNYDHDIKDTCKQHTTKYRLMTICDEG